MAVARINIKNIDYFKYKKLIIDGSRDDYTGCSKDVKAFCDCVQTINFRDEEFDDESDRKRFDEVCLYYKQILSSKRIDPTDMRIKSGWWGDHKNSYSAGKLKPSILKDTLAKKTNEWAQRHNAPTPERLMDKLDGPGLYVIKHRDHQCFQFVGRADNIFTRFSEKMRNAFDGSLQEPLAALLIMSMASDWEFYFTPVHSCDDERILRILENDLILKHDTIWPHGLNFRLHIDSLLEVSEFRKSCLRHNWPPNDVDQYEAEINLNKIRKQMVNHGDEPVASKPIEKQPEKIAEKVVPKSPRKQISLSHRPEWKDHVDMCSENDDSSDRPTSPMSDISTATYIVEQVDGASVQLEYQTLIDAKKPMAFTVPVEAVSNTPRKIRPGTVTITSKKDRARLVSRGELISASTSSTPISISATDTADVKPKSSQQVSSILLNDTLETVSVTSDKSDGKENSPLIGNDTLRKSPVKHDSNVSNTNINGHGMNIKSGTNVTKSPRVRLTRPTSAGKTRPDRGSRIGVSHPKR